MTSIATLGIEVKSRGVKEAERDLKALEKQGAETEKAATKMGKAWGLAIGGAVVAGVGVAALAFKKYIANSIEAEKVQAQLAARIKSTGMAAGLAIGDLNKMADALQAATTFDDESINKAQSVLLTFTKVGKESFGRATEAVLDMSVALGTDLQSAALQVGKALNDPVRGVTALARAGVQFTQSQKDTIKALVETGDVARAQSLILKELETQMGGSARAARDTLGGAIEALKNSFDNLLEGDVSNGGLKGTKDAIEGLNNELNDPALKAGIDTMANGLIRIANAAVVAVGQLGNAISALREYYGADASKGINVLKTQLDDAERSLVRLKKSSVIAPSNASLPFLDKLFGLPSGRSARIKAAEAEVAKYEGLLDKAQTSAAKASRTGKFSESYEAASLNFNPNPLPVGGKTPKATGGGRAKTGRAMPDFAADAARELARLAELEDRATESFKDIQAQLEGPMSVAMRDHAKRVEELNALAKESPTALAGFNDALALEAKRHAEATKEVERQLNPLRELTDSFAFELEMIGKSNAERAVMIELRRNNIDAMSSEAISALETAKAFEFEAEKKQQSIYLMDQFRNGAADAFTDIVTGAKSAKDALADFLDSLAEQITRAIAENLIGQLLGSQGTGSGSTGTGAGDWVSGLFGALLGGGRAVGGPTSGGRVYEVNERGAPEMFSSGGRNWMLSASDGSVTPMTQSSGNGGQTVIQNVTIAGRVDNSTLFQLRKETARGAKTAASRS